MRREQAALERAATLRQAYLDGRIDGVRLAVLLARAWRAPVLTGTDRFAGAVEPPDLARGFARLADGRWVVSADTPHLSSLLAMTPGMLDGRIVLAAPDVFRDRLRAHLAGRLAADASLGLEKVRPGASARTGALLWQKLAAVALLIFVLAALANPLGPVASALLLVAGALFGISIVTHLGVMLLVPAAPRGTLLNRADLPGYGVMVPLHREAAVVPELVEALCRLDYPRDRLDIRFVVEADDAATIAALRSARLPNWMQIVVAPPGQPRTKPRALNIAMAGMNCEFVTVYDAEDQPDPDQLLLAVAGFRARPDNVVCLQARLAIDGQHKSWLTRLFGIEYAALFDVVKPGLAEEGLPVPLGGTSNHFRRRALVELGGWDAWNVTEDADLGLRIARAGLRVADLPSTTRETAPASLRAWLPQRRRWLKGWMQTLITHTRHPLALCRELGLHGTLGFLAVTAGIIAGTLGFPFLTTLFFYRVAFGPPFHGGLAGLPDAVGVVVFAAGILNLIVPPLLGCRRRGRPLRARELPMLLAHALLVCLAGWQALYELCVAPFRWNKTEHRPRREGAMRNGRFASANGQQSAPLLPIVQANGGFAAGPANP